MIFCVLLLLLLYMFMKRERAIFVGLLYPAICMYAWSTELLNARIFFTVQPLLPLMIILTKKPYEYCNVQFDYNDDDDSDDGGNDVIRGRVQKIQNYTWSLMSITFTSCCCFWCLHKTPYHTSQRKPPRTTKRKYTMYNNEALFSFLSTSPFISQCLRSRGFLKPLRFSALK